MIKYLTMDIMIDSNELLTIFGVLLLIIIVVKLRSRRLIIIALFLDSFQLLLYLFPCCAIDNFICTEGLQVLEIEHTILELLSYHLVFAIEQTFEPCYYLNLASCVVSSLLLEILEDVLSLSIIGLAA